MSHRHLHNSHRALLPTIESLLLALMAFWVVIVMRIGFHPLPVFLIAESLFHLALPFGLMFLFSNKIKRQKEAGNQRSVVYKIQLGAMLTAFAPLLYQMLSRSFGFGEATETVLLTMFLYATWFLAVYSRFASWEHVSFMMSSSIILFTCFKAPSTVVYVVAFFYSVVALWWLFGQYWNRLEPKAIDAQHRNLTLRSVTMLTSIVVLTVATVALFAFSPLRQTMSVRGFMPFSGGNSWPDAYARSGIGDGEMLTGGPNATTTGAVDSEEFIEDDKPSMYDIMSDTYSGPMKIRKRSNRAVALAATAKHIHQVVQSEQEGRSFRTVRKTPQNENLQLEHRRTNALFFVEGSVPARFAVDRFEQFDGWDWTKVDLVAERIIGTRGAKKTPIVLERKFGKPWFVVQNVEREYLSYNRAHRVKMMRLKTNTLPSPALLKSWHIHRVEDESLFYWDDHGTVAMQGELIPTHTMIDLVSTVPNYHVLRTSENLQLVNHCNPSWETVDKFLGVGSESGTSVGGLDPREYDPENLFVQIPDNESKSRVTELAREWTSGHRPGWNQVEAIVNRLRTEYEHDASLVASDDGRDSVGSFLDQKGGPSYLFATAATQLLRAAGYRTRMARGFLVQRKDFDRLANQSIVTSENLHMWPEVCLDGWHWIPVEPTPGFPIPYNNQTLWQWVQAKLMLCVAWIKHHPITFTSVLAILVLGHLFRRELVLVGSSLLWIAAFFILPSRRLKTTRQLIDVRFWAAGYPRPSFASISDWFVKVDPVSAGGFVRCWLHQNFCSSEPNGSSNREVQFACRNVVAGLTLRKIKKFANTNS